MVNSSIKVGRIHWIMISTRQFAFLIFHSVHSDLYFLRDQSLSLIVLPRESDRSYAHRSCILHTRMDDMILSPTRRNIWVSFDYSILLSSFLTSFPNFLHHNHLLISYPIFPNKIHYFWLTNTHLPSINWILFSYFSARWLLSFSPLPHSLLLRVVREWKYSL